MFQIYVWIILKLKELIYIWQVIYLQRKSYMVYKSPFVNMSLAMEGKDIGACRTGMDLRIQYPFHFKIVINLISSYGNPKCPMDQRSGQSLVISLHFIFGWNWLIFLTRPWTSQIVELKIFNCMVVSLSTIGRKGKLGMSIRKKNDNRSKYHVVKVVQIFNQV